MKVTKAADVELSGAPSEEQLEKINRLTKTKVTAEDVYVFSVRLCDDQVDRDDERGLPDFRLQRRNLRRHLAAEPLTLSRQRDVQLDIALRRLNILRRFGEEHPRVGLDGDLDRVRLRQAWRTRRIVVFDGDLHAQLLCRRLHLGQIARDAVQVKAGGDLDPQLPFHAGQELLQRRHELARVRQDEDADAIDNPGARTSHDGTPSEIFRFAERPPPAPGTLTRRPSGPAPAGAFWSSRLATDRWEACPCSLPRQR